MWGKHNFWTGVLRPKLNLAISVDRNGQFEFWPVYHLSISVKLNVQSPRWPWNVRPLWPNPTKCYGDWEKALTRKIVSSTYNYSYRSADNEEDCIQMQIFCPLAISTQYTNRGISSFVLFCSYVNPFSLFLEYCESFSHRSVFTTTTTFFVKGYSDICTQDPIL